MKQFWYGGLAFLGGVILTFWLMSEPGGRQPQDSRISTQPATSQNPALASSLDDSYPNETIDVPSVSDGSRLEPNDETAFDSNSVVSEISGADGISVPILPGIELSGDVQVFHGMLEQEARDVLWAVPMETELYNYFFQNSPELADNFGVPNVVCRTTICEVQAIGYGQGSLEAWQAATSDLDSQPWAEEFIQVQLGGNQVGPDAEGLVLVLVRASGDATVQAMGGSVAAI